MQSSRLISILLALCLTSAPDLALRLHSHDCCSEATPKENCHVCYVKAVGGLAVVTEAIALRLDLDQVATQPDIDLSAPALAERYTPAAPRGPPA